jgi:hypothetical protein
MLASSREVAHDACEAKADAGHATDDAQPLAVSCHLTRHTHHGKHDCVS